MKQRFLIEQLEDRSVPTVTASLVNGQLLVKGPPAGAVVITETAAGAFQVTDNGASVGTVSGATGITVIDRERGAPINDNVTVNLNGFSTGSVVADLGGGNNAFTLEGGTVTGNVAFFAARGNDTVTIAAGTTVNGNVLVNLGRGSHQVEIDGAVGGNLMVNSPNPNDTVTINAALGGSVASQVIENLGTGTAVSQPGQCDGPNSPDPVGDPGAFLHLGPPPFGPGPLPT